MSQYCVCGEWERGSGYDRVFVESGREGGIPRVRCVSCDEMEYVTIVCVCDLWERRFAPTWCGVCRAMR